MAVSAVAQAGWREDARFSARSRRVDNLLHGRSAGGTAGRGLRRLVTHISSMKTPAQVERAQRP